MAGEIEIIPLNPESPVFLTTPVPSIPSLVAEGRVVAVDPLEPEFIESLLTGNPIQRFVPTTREEIIERFAASVKSSGLLAIHMVLGGLKLEDLVTTDFPEVAARTYFSKLPGNSVREAVLSERNRIEEELKGSLIRSVAFSYVRDLWVSAGRGARRLLNMESLRLWAVAKLSHGLAYTPLSAEPLEGQLVKLLEHVENSFERIVDRIESYVRELLSDREVYELLLRGSRGRKC